LNNWSFAGAMEVAPNFSLGASLNLWTGKDDYQLSFTETDAPYDLYTFDKFRIEDNVVSSFSGFNVKLAGMYRPISNFRLGFTVGTPVTYTVKDEWRTTDETSFDDPGVESATTSDAGQIEYKIRSPFSFGVGASLNLVNLLLAAGVESNDWSQIRYVSDPPFDDLSKVEANEELAYRYRQTLRYHLGAEFTLPIIDLQLRGGYFYDPTPLSADYYPGGVIPEDANREFLTAGVGIFLDKQVRLDVGAITGKWRDYKDPLTDFADDTDDDVPLTEKITFNKVFASLAIRF
jgi:long-subunit fatty acid transport protein